MFIFLCFRPHMHTVARAHTHSFSHVTTHTHAHSCARTHTQFLSRAHTRTHTHRRTPPPHQHQHTAVTYHSSWHVSLRNSRRTGRGNVVAHACTRYSRQLQRGIYGTQTKRRFGVYHLVITLAFALLRCINLFCNVKTMFSSVCSLN